MPQLDLSVFSFLSFFVLGFGFLFFFVFFCYRFLVQVYWVVELQNLFFFDLQEGLVEESSFGIIWNLVFYYLITVFPVNYFLVNRYLVFGY